MTFVAQLYSIVLKMDSIRVLITNTCNANCHYCFKPNSKSEYISFDNFSKLACFFSEAGVPRIRLMGGEPSIHPDFNKLTRIAQEKFSIVTIFTNGISEKISDFKPRKSDGINYNGNSFNKISEQRFLLSEPGNRTLQIVISSSLYDVKKYEQAISRAKDIGGSRFKIALSLNCGENIFKERKILIQRYEHLLDYCDSKGLDTIIDHGMPLCFVYGSRLPIRKDGCWCNENCCGLVDVDMNFKMCYQHAKDFIPLIDNSEFTPFQILQNFVKRQLYKNYISAMNKICLYCPFYDMKCNGGCFIASDNIKTNDIIENTEFPII